MWLGVHGRIPSDNIYSYSYTTKLLVIAARWWRSSSLIIRLSKNPILVNVLGNTLALLNYYLMFIKSNLNYSDGGGDDDNDHVHQSLH